MSLLLPMRDLLTMLRKVFHLSQGATTVAAMTLALATGQATARDLQQLTPIAVARGSEALIKIYDPLVQSVNLVAPAPAGTRSACGTTLSDQPGEAFYCTKDKTIYISNKTLKVVADRFGIAAAAAIVAHEFAHARQHALTGFLSTVVWSEVFDELQADCVAGVYMREATPIKMSDAQINQVKAFMAKVGDYEFFNKDWHGTPQMRVMAYSLGYQGGSLSSCAASQTFNWKEVLNGNPTGLNELLQQGPKLLPGLQ